MKCNYWVHLLLMEPEFVNVIIYFVWIAVAATAVADNNNDDDIARLFYWEGANKTAYNSQWKRKQRTYCTKLRSILFVQPKDRPFSSCSFCFCIGIGIGIVFFLSLFPRYYHYYYYLYFIVIARIAFIYDYSLWIC